MVNSKIDGTVSQNMVKDDSKVLNAIEQSDKKFNELEKLYNNSTIMKIFPNKVQKELIEAQAHFVKQQIEFKKRNHRIIKEFEAQTVTEVANKLLESGKAYIRKALAIEFQELHHQLGEELREIDNKFARMAEEEFKQIDKIENEIIKRMRLDNIMSDIEKHNTIRNKSLQRFSDILDERINSLDGKTKVNFV